LGGYLKLIRCLKGLIKIKEVFRFDNFPIIRIGDLTPIMELLMGSPKGMNLPKVELRKLDGS
jgi:hypothetical protein